MARTYTLSDTYHEVTDRIVAALEQGVAPWVCPWRPDSCGEGGRPHNGGSGHQYKGINVVLTGMSGFASSRWYTYRQALALGGQVRRGERGTTVIYWQFIEAKAAADGEGAYARGRKIPVLKSYTVFNAEQITWPEGSTHVAVEHVADADGADGNYEYVEKAIASTGATIEHHGVRACYSPSEDKILVPAKSRFDGAAAYFATMLHELGHWTGHESRLARDLNGRFGSESYAAEELVAELAAAFLCADLGVAGHLQHAEYIGSWIKVLKSDKRAIFAAARLAQEAADYILGRRTVNDHGEPVIAEQEAA